MTEAKRSASPDLHLAVALSLSTGARRGEVIGLRWRDVDLQRGVLAFFDMKNGDTPPAPMSGEPHGFDPLQREPR